MARPRRAKITDPDLARLMALAEPSRWAMVRLLAEGPRSVGEVAVATRLSPAVTSRHLQRLRAAGLVVVERRGKNLECALAGEDSAAGRWLATALGLRAPAAAARPARHLAPDELPARPPAPERLPKREIEDFLL